MALLFNDDKGALCQKERFPMPIQGKVVEDDDGNLGIEVEEEERKKDKKTYDQLEFEYDYNISDDQVAPI